MDKPVYKKHKRYLFYRVYCILIIIVTNIIGLGDYIIELYQDFFFSELLIFAFVLPAMLMIANLVVFRFPYSIFGELETTNQPTNKYITSSTLTGGSIGWFWASFPFFSWYLHKDGIRFFIIGVGKGFISFKDVVELKSGFLIGHNIYHNSKEVRSPLSVVSSKFFKNVKKQYEKYQLNA